MKISGALILCILLAGGDALAQSGTSAQSSSGSGQTALILPASGRNNQSGSVAATEQPVPGTTTSVNTLNPSVQISGPYSGSTRSTTARPFSGKLSLREALERGLAFNLGAVDLTHTLRQNRGQVSVARAALLPNLTGAVSETIEQVNLAALGFHFSLPATIPGFHIPTVAGPFNYMNLQVSLSQNLANFTAIHNYRAAEATARAAQYSLQNARDLITLAVGGAYLQVLTAQARLDASQAQYDTANAVFHQSTEQHAEGVLGRLNVDQSQLRTLNQQQQLITLRNDLAKQKINLARLVGLPPDPGYQLTDSFPFSPVALQDVNQAVAQAEQQREDLKAAQSQVEAAARALSAARAERLPSLAVSGDYQVIGTNPSQAHGAFAVTGTLSIPIWQGGRVGGDVAQAEGVLAQRRAELEDTRGQIESEIRQVYLDLAATAGQVEVANKNLQVAREALEMSQARMQAGIINTVEVVQAQQTVASAQLDLIDSIFAHNLAKLSLARALGHAADRLPSLLQAQTNPAP
jgi:outer membrane protein TolC